MTDVVAEWRRQRLRMGRQLDALDRAIVSAWVAGWDEIADELDAIMRRIAAEGPRVGTANQLRQAQQALRLVSDEIDRLAADGIATISDAARRVIADGVDDTRSLIAAQMPAGSALGGDAFAVPAVGATRAIMDRTTQQIVSRSWPLSDDAEKAMRTALRRGVAVGEHPEETARRMVAECRSVFDGGLTRAVTIARTEVIDAHRAVNRATERANANVLTGWRWQADLTSRTCPACLAMSGTVHPTDEPGPLGHPRCRCARIPITRTWRDLGFDIDEPGRDPKTGPEWFAAQPEATQRAILGDARYKRYQAGTPLSDMVERVPSPDWRDSYQVKPLRRL